MRGGSFGSCELGIGGAGCDFAVLDFSYPTAFELCSLERGVWSVAFAYIPIGFFRISYFLLVGVLEFR